MKHSLVSISRDNLLNGFRIALWTGASSRHMAIRMLFGCSANRKVPAVQDARSAYSITRAKASSTRAILNPAIRYSSGIAMRVPTPASWRRWKTVQFTPFRAKRQIRSHGAATVCRIPLSSVMAVLPMTA